MTPLERLLAEAGTCQVALDPVTADRSIRSLGTVCGILVGLEFCAKDREQHEALKETRAELAALRQLLILGRGLSGGD